VTTYDALASLPLRVESYELERLEQAVSSEFTRVTTVVHLRGDGEEGVGEDVTYAAELHPPPGDLALQDRCQHSTRTAPCGPEVDDDRHRSRALDDGGLECRVCDVHRLRVPGKSPRHS